MIVLRDICSSFRTCESLYLPKVNVMYIQLCKEAWKIIFTIDSISQTVVLIRNRPAILLLMEGLKRVLKAQT